VSNKIWPIIDPIVKHHQDSAVKRKILSELEMKILESIESEGSIRTDRLRKKLKLEGKENNSKFHHSINNLETYALIVGVEDPKPERHLHANIWQTWDKRTRGEMGRGSLSYSEAVARLFEKTLDACVLAREDQIGKWFDWSGDMQAVKEQLLENETILKAGPYLISSQAPNVNS
jgi:hypothetical protein